MAGEVDVPVYVVIRALRLRIIAGGIEAEQRFGLVAEGLIWPGGARSERLRRGAASAPGRGAYARNISALVVGGACDQRQVVLLPLRIGSVDVLRQKPAINDRAVEALWVLDRGVQQFLRGGSPQRGKGGFADG